MLDDLQKRPNEAQRTPESRADVTGPVADREVPLSGTAAAYDGLHRWLDGEGTEAEARQGKAARAVDLWHKIDDETARRRRLTTPAGLDERIMLALPEHAPAMATHAETTWWRKSIELSPVAAAAAAAGLVALGVALGSRLR